MSILSIRNFSSLYKDKLALVIAIFLFLIILTPLAHAETKLVPDCQVKDNCTLQDFFNLLGSVYKYIVFIAAPLAVLGIGVGGFRMILGSASEGERTKGREILSASVIGLLIVLASWIIVNAILVGLGANFANPLK